MENLSKSECFLLSLIKNRFAFFPLWGGRKLRSSMTMLRFWRKMIKLLDFKENFKMFFWYGEIDFSSIFGPIFLFSIVAYTWSWVMPRSQHQFSAYSKQTTEQTGYVFPCKNVTPSILQESLFISAHLKGVS